MKVMVSLLTIPGMQVLNLWPDVIRVNDSVTKFNRPTTVFFYSHRFNFHFTWYWSKISPVFKKKKMTRVHSTNNLVRIIQQVVNEDLKLVWNIFLKTNIFWLQYFKLHVEARQQVLQKRCIVPKVLLRSIQQQRSLNEMKVAGRHAVSSPLCQWNEAM